MSIMFATSQGNVRRNSLMDFVNVQSNGKIAMKLDEGDKLINVRICHEDNDIMLAARSGKCIRFPVTDVRVFVGRNSTGVRGIKLAEGDEVISMSILLHSDATSEERDEYARIASAIKRISAERGDDSCVSPEDTGLLNVLTTEKYKEMAEREQFILSVTSTGYGKRTSSYEYRVTGRGGQGIAAFGGNTLNCRGNAGIFITFFRSGVAVKQDRHGDDFIAFRQLDAADTG
jgi:DNA gyrase subunit A